MHSEFHHCVLPVSVMSIKMLIIMGKAGHLADTHR